MLRTEELFKSDGVKCNFGTCGLKARVGLDACVFSFQWLKRFVVRRVLECTFFGFGTVEALPVCIAVEFARRPSLRI